MIFLGLLIVFYISAGLSYSSDSSEFFGHIGVCQSSYDKFVDLLKNKKENSFDNLTRGNISISNLSFGYSGHDNILQNINLIIPDKKKLAIMGRSGSGKSTLAKLILKLGDYKGQIKINDIDIQKIDSTTLRKKVIYINQRTELLEDTVIQNIKYGLNIKDKEIISILTKYQLQEVFSGLNQGIYEKCLIDGKNLSLGMQKVIILVRGILHSGNSLINIFDEPLAGLDQKSRKKVINMILQECKYKTVLIITHDPEVIPYMDRTFNINQYDS
jgi:ABC-type bacteriocin/lantibiotic exporter with double-glycine peptidase domain